MTKRRDGTDDRSRPSALGAASSGGIFANEPWPENLRAWFVSSVCLLAAGLLLTTGSWSHAQLSRGGSPAGVGPCAGDNGGITLPPGFCATVFADGLGHIAPSCGRAERGRVREHLERGYYRPGAPPPGGFLVALKDTKGDGRADQLERFGTTAAEGGAGGTGIAVYDGYVYAEANDVSSAINCRQAGSRRPEGETIVSGLPLSGDHPMHPFAIDRAGNLYVDLGSATNSCQSAEPHAGRAGEPAVHGAGNARWHLALRRQPAGSAISRRRSGSRRGCATARASRSTAGRIFATQHGRDQSGRTGRGSTRRCKAPTSRPRSWWSCSRAAISAGRNAIMTICSTGWCWLRSMAATEAGRRGSAHRSRRRLPRSRRTGRRTTCLFTRATSFRPRTRTARSSRSTDPGTAHPNRRAGTTWCSSR